MNFDLEKAKAGEPIEYQEAYGWIEIPFIGVWDAQRVVCKAPWNDKPEIVPVGHLRMAKKRQVMRYRNYTGIECGEECMMVLNQGDSWLPPEKIEKKEWFTGWIHHDWQEYEIGAND